MVGSVVNTDVPGLHTYDEGKASPAFTTIPLNSDVCQVDNGDETVTCNAILGRYKSLQGQIDALFIVCDAFPLIHVNIHAGDQ